VPGRMALLGTGRKEEVPAEEFGNKAAMLERIGALSLRIPPAFVLGVSVCEDYFANGRRLPGYVSPMLDEGIAYLERSTGLQFGAERKPLLVSVRSGAPVSMPGMMSTVLDVGMGRGGVRGLMARSGNPRFGWDCYRRLISSYARGVARHDPRAYDRLLADKLRATGAGDETELDWMAGRSLAEEFEGTFARLEGTPFPQDPAEQLHRAVGAIMDSWASPRAEAYRRMNAILGARGTAVTVQAMVFGNMNFLSGSGVAFTRNPWTGATGMVMDFRFGVQGEDVVSGEEEADQESRFKRSLPQAYKEVQRAGRELEASLRDMQDVEFTVQEGELYLLQTRSGNRSPLAALRMAVEMAEEGIITRSDAVDRTEGIDPGALVEQKIVAGREAIAKGTSASSGIVTGEAVLSTEAAMERAGTGPVILVKETVTPDDMAGITAAVGVITARGNRMAHAVVVARQLGKACVVNVPGLVIDPPRRAFVLAGRELREGAVLSMDSGTGEIFEGPVQVISERPNELLDRIREWREESAPHPAR
jgi:pyruvate,orthophosphate dikinase